MKWISRILLVLVCIVLAAVLGILIVYRTIPLGNTDRDRFDTIIVLGFPANADGSASVIERERVTAAVAEYKAGVAPTLIMTGGKAHNEYVEAHVMAKYAEALGVPGAAIVEENNAHDTIQNAYYSTRIMNERGWKSAEVVSSNSHLPRASLIFARFPIQYRMHGANPLRESSALFAWAAYADEAYKTDRIRIFGFRPNRYLP